MSIFLNKNKEHYSENALHVSKNFFFDYRYIVPFGCLQK